MSFIVIFVLSSLTDLINGENCAHEIEFQSNMSIETLCTTKLEECSFRYLSLKFPRLFDDTAWAPVEPEPPILTSFCQTDSKGVNHAGVNISWSPPMNSGARDITGFEVEVDGRLPGPGHKCILIIFKENLTQSMIRSVFTGSIYPLKRNEQFSISLFSLPKSKMSVIVPKSFSTPKCEDENVSSHWHTQDFKMDYNQRTKRLNVSFPSPPAQFNFTHFSVTLTSVRTTKTFIKTTINQTFHVFHPIFVGNYRIFLQPEDPHPFNNSLCKCKDDRNRCERCMTSRIDFSLRRSTPVTLIPTQGILNSTRTTQIIIKKVFKNKRQKEKKDKTTKKVLRYLFPSCVAVAGVLIMLASFFYVKRKLKRKGECLKAEGRGDKTTHSVNVDKQDSRFVLLVDGADKHATCNSFHTEFYPIVQGMFGKTVAIQTVLNSAIELETKLRHCLNISYKKDAMTDNTVLSTAANDCSKTGLLEDKQIIKLGGHLDCCGKKERHVNVIVVICIFVDKNTSLKALESLKHVIDSLHSDNVDFSSLYVSFGKEDMPYCTAGMKRFSYKDDLSKILSFIKEQLCYPGDQQESRECQEGIMTSKNSHCATTKHLTDMDDQGRELLRDHYTDDCWKDWPGVVLVPRTVSSEMTKRNRYLSNDSGWGASEHSFRSTPKEEVADSSSKSSTQSSMSGADLDTLAAHPSSDCFNIANRLGPSQLTSQFSKPSPVSSKLSPGRSVLKCPSDVFFFPPDDLSLSSKRTAEKTPEAYAHQTTITGVEGAPCIGSTGFQSKSERRCSPSVDSLMNMLKTINDESMRFMESEANAGDVYSVFEGVA